MELLVHRVLLLALLGLQAQAVTQIVAFGDSITDDCTHGAKQIVDEALNTTKDFPGPPWYRGCFFSSGPTYALVAARLLNISLTNYAIGGATSGAVPNAFEFGAGFGNNTKAVSIAIPNTLQQAETYIRSQKGRVPGDALYIVYIGANDYLTTISRHNNATVDAVLDYTGRTMHLLYKAGARVFLTQTQPMWGDTPSLQDSNQAIQGNNVSSSHNRALGPFLAGFAAGHLEASLILFDYATLQGQMRANATALGFTKTMTACYVAGDPDPCSNPHEYIFWDHLHFTGHVHQLWGQAVATQIRPLVTSVPVSSVAGRWRKLMLRRMPHHVRSKTYMYGKPL